MTPLYCVDEGGWDLDRFAWELCSWQLSGHVAQIGTCNHRNDAQQDDRGPCRGDGVVGFLDEAVAQ
jgi:hypothetical protein